jgi:hypothetical protein
MSMIANAEYYTTTGEIFRDTYIVIPTAGISYISIIFEAFNENNQPVNFNNQKYSIDVCHNCWDDEPEDPYSFEEIMNPTRDWIHLLDIQFGSDTRCTNSFSEKVMGVNGVPLHFSYVRFLCLAIENVKVRITAGTR